jgi:hypothetical protein
MILYGIALLAFLNFAGVLLDAQAPTVRMPR